MQRILIARRGGPDRLQLVDAPDPVPGAGEVVIANEAVGVAFADVLMREGLYPGVRHPVTPGYEAVGRVVAAGDGAATWIDQRVAVLTVTGGYATHVVAPAADLVPVPDALPAPEAAALVLNGLTAWQMLTRVAPADSERVLVWGAAGGVGSLLLEMARHRGITALGVASGARLRFVEELGAVPVDRHAPDLAQTVLRLSDGGVDAVFDGVNGRTAATSLAALRPGGLVVLFGAQGGMVRGRPGLRTALEYARAPRWSSLTLLMRGRGAAGYLVTDYKAAHPARYRQDLATVFDLAAAGRVRPRIGLSLSLAQAAEAHRRMNAGDVTGKIVLLP